MIGIWTLVTAAISFGVSALIAKWLIPFLRKVKFGQEIREEGPKWHQSKSGTPTMGGFIFIIGSIVAFGVGLLGFYISNQDKLFGAEPYEFTVKVIAGFIMALFFGAIGFVDDYIKVIKKRNLGLRAYQKLLMQFAVAASYLATLAIAGCSSATLIPFVGYIDLGFWYYILSGLLIVGIVNAVNFTDGIDGLCGSVTFFYAIFFMLIASFVGRTSVNILSVSCAGSCMGFLIYNLNPAKVFMGDTGSLFLGGFCAAMAFGCDMPILMIPLGIVYIFEILSVVIQVTYFKLTHGKRVFKMTPIHHHFEMCGFSEMKICIIASAVTIIMGIACVLLVLFGVTPFVIM